ncbi:MAG: serine/threonine protein kinase [Deltaproteobacteria bacterium]|nr:serine/threonine protein kinase [Deltaproteobacteria bacterium]MBW2536738.1 serine/threonine protein kinase [Deltaproteobacteria bacterium]
MPKPEPDAVSALGAEDVIADRYELVEELERGGMGMVWIAIDRKLDRKIALKIMVANSEDSRERFEREAKTVAGLRSEHVVEVHDYGVDDGVPYIAMELLEGESLGTRLKRIGSLPVAEVADILVQTAKGLKAAHGAGLVHRDLKPSNIFLAHRDDREVVKLLDFGVVKAVDQTFKTESTASGVVLGTPQYMSPEQARGIKEIDHRADLWSLGVITLRMLTGNNPFGSDSVGDAVIKICIEPIPKASEFQGIPDELDLFFERALARDPEARFQTAIDLARDFLHRVGLSSPELRGERHSRLDLVDADRLSAVDTGRHATVPDRESVPELTPPPLPAARDSSPSSSRSAKTPHSATVGGTQITRSISLRVPTKRRRRWYVAGGAAMAVVGGALALALLGSSGTTDAGTTNATATSAATAEPTAAATGAAAAAPTTSGVAAASATGASDGGSETAADAATPQAGTSSKPSAGKPGRPAGAWTPPGHTRPGQTPQWY